MVRVQDELGHTRPEVERERELTFERLIVFFTTTQPSALSVFRSTCCEF